MLPSFCMECIVVAFVMNAQPSIFSKKRLPSGSLAKIDNEKLYQSIKMIAKNNEKDRNDMCFPMEQYFNLNDHRLFALANLYGPRWHT